MTTFVDQVTLLTAAFMNAVAAVIEAVPITALSAVTPAADKLPYFTGASSAAVTDLSVFARTLLDDADAASMRATLGVSSESSDAELAAIAGLTSAADTLPYFTGPGTAALTTLSSFMRTLLDDASAAAARSTLGAAPTASPTLTGTIHLEDSQMDNHALSEAKTLSFNGIIDDGNTGTTKTIDFGTGQYHKATMTGNCTFTFTAPPGACVVHLELYQDGTGSRVMTLPGSVKWDASYAAGDKLLTTTASARDMLILRWNGTDYIANLMKGIA